MKLMKMSVVSFFCLLVASGVAQAKVAINWTWDDNRSEGVYLSDGVTLLPQASTVQLIWSSLDSGLSAMNVLNPLTPTGAGEVVLATKASSGDGYWNFGVGNYEAAMGTYVGGYVYQRVFNVSVGDTPVAGVNQYGESVEASAQLVDASAVPAPAPIGSYLWDSSVSGGGYVMSVIAVPEPTTIALAFAGLGLLVVRRFRKKKD